MRAQTFPDRRRTMKTTRLDSHIVVGPTSTCKHAQHQPPQAGRQALRLPFANTRRGGAASPICCVPAMLERSQCARRRRSKNTTWAWWWCTAAAASPATSGCCQRAAAAAEEDGGGGAASGGRIFVIVRLDRELSLLTSRSHHDLRPQERRRSGEQLLPIPGGLLPPPNTRPSQQQHWQKNLFP